MKKFVIKPPKAGRSTVELIAHPYLSKEAAKAQGLERGTQTIYLGSFSMNLDPGRLAGVLRVIGGDASSGISLRPHVIVDGQTFELDAQDVNQIRDWLVEHGSYLREQQRLVQIQAEREKELIALRQRLEAEIRLELRESLRAELLSELKPSAAIPALSAAVDALDTAAAAVTTEVDRLTASCAHRSTRRLNAAHDSDLGIDALREATERLRRTAFREFEEACQDAGLMKRRRRSGSGSNLAS